MISQIHAYEVCPKGIQPCNMKKRHLLNKIQETLYIGRWRLSPFQSRHLGTSQSSPNIHQLPCHISWISLMIWNLFPFKDDFGFRKSQILQGAKSRLKGGWVTWVIWCYSKKLCRRRDSRVSMLLWRSCQTPAAHSCGLLNHPNSFRKGRFKLNEKYDADSLLY